MSLPNIDLMQALYEIDSLVRSASTRLYESDPPDKESAGIVADVGNLLRIASERLLATNKRLDGMDALHEPGKPPNVTPIGKTH